MLLSERLSELERAYEMVSGNMSDAIDRESGSVENVPQLAKVARDLDNKFNIFTFI